jgi:hypothetical protein
MSAAKKHDPAEAITSEIKTFQDERVVHEQAMHARRRELDAARTKEDADLQEQWHGGLRDIDVKIRNAAARLTVARAEKLKADAAAAAARQDAAAAGGDPK